MKFLKSLYYSYQIWSYNRRSDNYMSYDWPKESLEAADKALYYERKKKALYA